MKRIQYLILLLTACLLLTGCGIDKGYNDQMGSDSDSTDTSASGTVEPSVDLLEFAYGRLVIDNRFVMLSQSNMNFTLNFEKRIFTPNDDIQLTVYVANYTGEELSFSLADPIVSRQQLIHASLTYGDGLYSVPVTIEYEEEADLAGGVFDVAVRNRKLLATTVTFHTSAYENVEDSIFSDDFADSYELRFWFGDDEYAYAVQTPISFASIDWSNAGELQTIVLPESYVRLVGDVRFTATFDRAAYGTDEDIHLHVKVENLGKTPISLYSDSDISQAEYYIRAEMTYGNQTPVRNNVASPSEIAGIESRAQLKYQEVLEREITFYTSEFTNAQRSPYHRTNKDRCEIRVWLLVENRLCEINIPIEYADYDAYSYQNREVPLITTTPMVTTTEPVETITEPEVTTTEPIETTTEPEVTTTEPVETTTGPEVTTTEPVETTTGPVETTIEPTETTGPEVKTTEPIETTTGQPITTTGGEA